ncbi:MAG: hypothetical protein PHX61_06005 [Alphaproteobacteria bacterium]|nr:hypothetical protein [Alphaproteobacteria bacterium]
MTESLINLPAKFQEVSAPPIFTSADAHEILNWLLYKTRGILKKTLEDNPKDIANAFRDVADIATAPLHGRCSFSQAVAAYALKERGFSPKNFSLQSIEDHTIGHASLTVEIGQNTYLIDPTYRQFFDPNQPIIEDRQIPMPGFKLSETEQGRSLLEKLMTDGYARIDPETANAYLSSFCNGVSPFATPEESYQFLKDPPPDQMEYHMSKNALERLGLLIPPTSH